MDVARDSAGRWRHPVRLNRIRIRTDMEPGEVPLFGMACSTSCSDVPGCVVFAGIMEADLEGATSVRLESDPVYGEVDLTATATELACLARAIADGEGFIRSASASAPASSGDGNTLAGVEARKAPGSGVRIVLDAQRQTLVISGDPDARAVLAENLHAMATAEDGGHLHIEYFPEHPYLVAGSLPLVVNSPHGGMPTG
ncbi:hypothetical protein OG381_01325 [Streptomyces sp. NBC_00490]|uniref:Imm32 family immunity protein n=1 Tax=Streptomyces sp. NBC_00490 TaxID=2903657 RepID=UPI002E175AD1